MLHRIVYRPKARTEQPPTVSITFTLTPQDRGKDKGETRLI